ncbi:MAG: serine--tRNA ligase [Flavobacteriales bacterium]|nr:serine--tRNA ligase [Flavobacteriales bacterium]|tara:strand:+ start:390 stop:1664 length:1275 start_codon:yes stop_codon:yes gene_type:complete
MLELNLIKKNSAEIIQKLAIRGGDYSQKINDILDLNEKRIKNQQALDEALRESNKIGQLIGQLAKVGNFEKLEVLKKKATQIKTKAKELNNLSNITIKDLEEKLVSIPNTPDLSVPIGNSANDNQEIYRWGKSNKSSQIKPHWELAEKYDIIDFENGSHITGSGFPIYKGMGAKLQRALINFFLEYNNTKGYTEYIPPYFVNEKSAFNTGQIPDKEGMMYHINEDNLFAIPTAEVPITNIFKNKRFTHKELPIKCTAYSPCFRREAGSYGKEVRGLNRLHQFDKVEIVQICQPEKSYEILEEMVSHVSELLKKLNLEFRIVKLCGGDLGFTAAMTYDFEVYSPAQKKWLEVSSVSNFETFQANRLKMKYINNETKEIQLCHTLNGSSLALPRIMAAILEQNQTDDGIIIPKAIKDYINFNKITV